MNFYKEQERSSKKTRLLLPLFIISVLIVVFAVGMLFIAISVFFDGKGFAVSPSYLLHTASYKAIFFSFLGVLLVIIYGIVKKSEELEDGGYVVAKQLGGMELLREKATLKEQILINVVDEMSIAAGIASVPIYIIESYSINAFVAGSDYDDAAFGVTRGAIEFLERDELQGIIAHEFSHIFNGDMRLNTYSSGCIGGIMYIFLIGMELLIPRISIEKSAATERLKNDTKKFRTQEEQTLGNVARATKEIASYRDAVRLGIYPLCAVCGVFISIAGVTGMICACGMQLLINRQREFLADASAVQFTRYPDGIANALKKIGGHSGVIRSINAGCYSHIFFTSWSSPKIEKRIIRIEPRWDGKYINLRKKHRIETYGVDISESAPIKYEPLATLTTVALLNQLSNSGNINALGLKSAAEALRSIPESLKMSAKNPLEAEFIIYALLFDENSDIQEKQLALTISKLFTDQAHQDAARATLLSLHADIISQDRSVHLDIIRLCVVTLKTISPNQYRAFKELVNELIEYDKRVSIFEWCLKYIVLYPLDIAFGLRKIPSQTHTHIGAIKAELEVLLSALSYSQCENDEKAKIIFDFFKRRTEMTTLRYVTRDEFAPRLLQAAVDEIQNSKPLIRKRVMELAIMCLGSAKSVESKNIAIIHALSEALHLPLGIEQRF